MFNGTNLEEPDSMFYPEAWTLRGLFSSISLCHDCYPRIFGGDNSSDEEAATAATVLNEDDWLVDDLSAATAHHRQKKR